MEKNSQATQENRLPLFPAPIGFGRPFQHEFKTILANRLQYWETQRTCADEDIVQKAIDETYKISQAIPSGKALCDIDSLPLQRSADIQQRSLETLHEIKKHIEIVRIIISGSLILLLIVTVLLCIWK